jgi:hypothetical protein
MNTDPRPHGVRASLRLVTPARDTTGQAADPAEESWQGIEASPDVVRALGAATVMGLRAEPSLRAYVCPFCDEPGRVRRTGAAAQQPGQTSDTARLADPAGHGGCSVVVLRYANGLNVARLAHATCSPSAVVRMLSTPTHLRHRIRASCWLRPTGTGTSSAVLLVDNQVRAWPRNRAQDADDHYTRALQTAGFTPLTDLDHLPPETSELTATITLTGDDDTARIRVAHRHALVLVGDVALPSAWLQRARHQRTIVVVTGTAVAPAVPSNPSAPDVPANDARRFLDGVADAVAAGRAWAAVAALTPAGERLDKNPPREWAG